jgi:hypothetical protein
MAKEENIENVEETVVETPKGRAAALEAYKQANPDNQEEPDDDVLHDFHAGRYSELDGKYNELNEANGKLAELIETDPKFGAVLSMVANGKSFPYAFANVYGKEPLELEGDSLDDFEKGYQEKLKQLASSKKEQAQANKNIEDYRSNLEKFKKDNNLTDEQAAEIDDAIFTDADNFLNGIIPVEYIEYKFKGMNYDKDVQEAAETGLVEGKNEAIEVKKAERKNAGAIPDMGVTTATTRKPSTPPKEEFDDVFKGVKSVPGTSPGFRRL